jgi:hypothetical protein
MQPERFSGRRLLRFSAWTIGGGYLGTLAGLLVGRFARLGHIGSDTLWEAVRGAAWQATPILLVISLSLLLLLWGVAHTKRLQVQRELQALRLVQERDLAARQAAEAQLKLLQGQIQPHFIFNTLAAVQHWVDTTDPRAGPLLKSLTAFLRGSTELLGREQVTLGEEALIVEHYLEIMQARLGARLHSHVEIAPELASQPVPPGLLLTLVENAIEHGVGPSLAMVVTLLNAAMAAFATLQAGPCASHAVAWRRCWPGWWRPACGAARVCGASRRAAASRCTRLVFSMASGFVADGHQVARGGHPALPMGVWRGAGY